jgi:hypothetical protein
MSIIDFANSYMTWFPHGGGNIARIQLDAACTVIDEQSGASETFYLIAPCRAERMYLDTPLFQLPNYEFCGIWSAQEYLIIRTAWASAQDNRQYGVHHERWTVRLDVRHFGLARQVDDADAIVDATLANLPLVARTTLHATAQGKRAILEYPIKTMNLMQNPARFQVDTGPLILPDFAAPVAHAIEQFEVAHVVYHTFDKAEFIMRKPVPLAEPTTDYSVVQIVPAHHELWCAKFV